jgi:hypothetical protein
VVLAVGFLKCACGAPAVVFSSGACETALAVGPCETLRVVGFSSGACDATLGVGAEDEEADKGVGVGTGGAGVDVVGMVEMTEAEWDRGRTGAEFWWFSAGSDGTSGASAGRSRLCRRCCSPSTSTLNRCLGSFCSVAVVPFSSLALAAALARASCRAVTREASQNMGRR